LADEAIAALELPWDARVDNRALLHQLEQSLVRRGVPIYRNVDNDEIDAGIAVIASGAWSGVTGCPAAAG
jgi:glycine/D-amino acid oxidase-like deaminating enzyme